MRRRCLSRKKQRRLIPRFRWRRRRSRLRKARRRVLQKALATARNRPRKLRTAKAARQVAAKSRKARVRTGGCEVCWSLSDHTASWIFLGADVSRAARASREHFRNNKSLHSPV